MKLYLRISDKITVIIGLLIILIIVVEQVTTYKAIDIMKQLFIPNIFALIVFIVIMINFGVSTSISNFIKFKTETNKAKKSFPLIKLFFGVIFTLGIIIGILKTVFWGN